jgi:hypothetical protein
MAIQIQHHNDIIQTAVHYGIDVEKTINSLKVVQTLSPNDYLDTTSDGRIVKNSYFYTRPVQRLWTNQNRQTNVKVVDKEVRNLRLIMDFCIQTGLQDRRTQQLFFRCLCQMAPLTEGISSWKGTYIDDSEIRGRMQSIIDYITDAMEDYRSNTIVLKALDVHGYGGDQVFREFSTSEKMRIEREANRTGVPQSATPRHFPQNQIIDE